jgi:DNA-binding winged helix-turn-helix (wHTH) protein/predicted ATPase
VPSGHEPSLAGTVFFPGFRFEAGSGRLWRDDEEVQLRPKTAAVLRYLLGRAGDVVTKQELMQDVWPDGFVGDAVLTVSINELRQALADDSRHPTYIATAHRRGYRFVAAVSSMPGGGGDTDLPARPFVGREAELTMLDEWWRAARQGRRQVVFVTAQAGVGKTALADAFVERCRNAGPLLVGRGQCVEQFGEGEAYLPLLDALSGLGCGVDGRHVRDVLRSTAPLWLLQLPRLVEPTEAEALRLQTVGASSQRMVRELGDALEVLTTERPLLLVCEDLHRSDRSTTELLAYLARRRDPARLMIVGTYRPADVFARSHPLRQVVRDLRTHGQCGFLPLELLSRSAITDYLSQRLTPRRPTDSLIADLHHRTDGNALFVTTVVDYLLDRGLVTDDADDVGTREPLDRLGIPDSVGQFVERQLDELEVEDRRQLEIAAAAGVEFSAETVHAAAKHDRPALQAADVADRFSALARDIGLLVELDLGEWPDGTVTAQFRFRHALYQEVLYGDLSPARRVAVHRRIGERLAEGYTTHAGDIAAELAMHFERGHDFERAIPSLAQAAETALRRAAHHEALDYADRGLRLLERTTGLADRPSVELRLRMMQTVALVTLHGAGAPGVDLAYQQARAVCAEIDDATLLGPVLYGLWSFAFNRGRMADATELSGELRQLADRRRDPVLEIQSHATAGYLDVLAGRPVTALPRLEQGLELYDRGSYRNLALAYGEDPGVGCHAWASYASWLLGAPDRARRHAADARELAQDLGYPNDIGQATWFATVIEVLCRDVDRVAVVSEELLQVCRQYDLTRWSAVGKVVRGWVVAQRGEPVRAVAAMREGLAEYSGTSGYPYFSSSLLAETLAANGDVTGALDAAAGALETARRNGEQWYEAELVRLRGELLLQDGDVSDAERAFLEAHDIATRQGARSHQLRAATSLARLWQSQGNPAKGRDLLVEAYGAFSEGHDTHDVRAAAALLAELG